MKKALPKIMVEKSLYDIYEDEFNMIFIVKTYLIYNYVSKKFKIGRSKDIGMRIKQLEKEYGNNIILIDYCKGDIEKSLHRFFSNKKDNGEWFNLNDDNIKFIKDSFNIQNQRLKELKKKLKKIK